MQKRLRPRGEAKGAGVCQERLRLVRPCTHLCHEHIHVAGALCGVAHVIVHAVHVLIDKMGGQRRSTRWMNPLKVWEVPPRDWGCSKKSFFSPLLKRDKSLQLVPKISTPTPLIGHWR